MKNKRGSLNPGAFLIEFLNPLLLFPVLAFIVVGLFPKLQISGLPNQDDLDGSWASLMNAKVKKRKKLKIKFNF